MEQNITDLLNHTQTFQRCQRNFDLSRELDIDTAKTLYEIALNVPSKQNFVNYDVVAVTNRSLIRKIAEASVSDDQSFLTPKLQQELKNGRLQNPQVDAHMLLMYFLKPDMADRDYGNRDPGPKGGPTKRFINWKHLTNLEIGISTGAVGLAANSLGLRTGFCKCFTESSLPQKEFEDIGIDVNELVVILGIGYPLHEDHTLHTDGVHESDSFTKLEQRKIII